MDPRILFQIIVLVALYCSEIGLKSVDGYMIVDLNANSSTYFTHQKISWQGLSTPSPTEITCNSSKPLLTPYLIGGNLIKEYNSLPLHNSAYITLNLWFIKERYFSNDKIDITILDSSNTIFNTSIIPVQSSTNWSSLTCNSNQLSLKDVVLNIRSRHTGNSLKLKFYVQNLAFFGLRDIKIMLSNQTIATSSFCIDSTDPNFLSSLQCPCPLKQYESSPGSCNQCHSTCTTCFNSLPTGCLSCTPGHSFNGTMCVPCHSSCETCFGTSQYECLTCHDGGYFHLTTHSCHSSSCLSPLSPIPFENYFVCTCQDGNYCYDRNSTCIDNCPFPAFKSISRSYGQFCEFNCSMGLYFYTNGSCISDCEPYFIRRDEGGYIYCDYPCSTAKYLYWNGTCSNCTFPLVPNNSTGYRYCTYPCSPGQYLYWNGSCIANCNFPLQQDRSEPGKYYCNYPCNTSQHLYWNGTCSYSCEYPFSVMKEANRNYCQLPCPLSSYLFENGSCIVSCPSPLVSSVIEVVNICKRPCPKNQFYFPDEKTCKTSCPLPYKFNETGISLPCELPVTENEKKNVQQVNSVSDSAHDATQGVISISVIASTDPGGSSASALSKMLQYTRYINLTYSAKLELMFKTKNHTSGFIPFLPPVYDSIKEKFTKYKVPAVFAKYNIHSSFLINLWEGIVSIGICFGLWTFVRIFEFLVHQLKNCIFSYRILRKSRMIIQSFILTQFYSIYSDILLFFAIEIKMTELNGLSLAVSFGSSMILVGFGLMIIFVHLKLIVDYQSIRTQINQLEAPVTLEKFSNDYEGMKVLYFNFKDDSFIQQAFFLFLNLRNAFFSLVIGLLFDYPKIQVIMLTIFTSVTILYLLVKRPFKGLINFLQQLFAEIMLVIVNVCLILLLYLELENGESKRDSLSQVIIICNLVIGFVAPIFGLAKVIVAIYNYIKGRRVNVLRDKPQIKLKEKRKQDNTINDSFMNDSQLKALNTNQRVSSDFSKNGNITHEPALNVLVGVKNPILLGKNLESKRIQKVRIDNLFSNQKLKYDPFTRSLGLKVIRKMQNYEDHENKKDFHASDILSYRANLGGPKRIKENSLK